MTSRNQYVKGMNSVQNQQSQRGKHQNFPGQSSNLNKTFDSTLGNGGSKNPAHLLSMMPNNYFSPNKNNLIGLSTLQGERTTKEGFIVTFTHPSLALFEKERYINPKMEEELRIFKKKIMMRFENSQIPKDYTFPRKQEEDYAEKGHSPEGYHKRVHKLVFTGSGTPGAAEQQSSKRRFFSQTFYNNKNGAGPRQKGSRDKESYSENKYKPPNRGDSHSVLKNINIGQIEEVIECDTPYEESNEISSVHIPQSTSHLPYAGPISSQKTPKMIRKNMIQKLLPPASDNNSKREAAVLKSSDLNVMRKVGDEGNRSGQSPSGGAVSTQRMNQLRQKLGTIFKGQPKRVTQHASEERDANHEWIIGNLQEQTTQLEDIYKKNNLEIRMPQMYSSQGRGTNSPAQKNITKGMNQQQFLRKPPEIKVISSKDQAFQSGTSQEPFLPFTNSSKSILKKENSKKETNKKEDRTQKIVMAARELALSGTQSKGNTSRNLNSNQLNLSFTQNAYRNRVNYNISSNNAGKNFNGGNLNLTLGKNIIENMFPVTTKNQQFKS